MNPGGASRRLALLLFFSGLCAIAYQTAWLRLLRLVFGASTAASAAVLAVFMLGLGCGSLVLGKRADRSENPLRLYARLEMAIAVLAALSPWLVAAARWLYIETGGTPALGPIAGTALRLLLAAMVLGPPTFLMGGTLPAITRAAEDERDRGRRTLGLLYGANTLGAVSGALLVTFVAVELLGTRKSILLAAALNLLVGFVARTLARDASAPGRIERGVADTPAGDAPAGVAPIRFALIAAALVGFVFFLMELVWYRMLSPLLGGSSYTFGLILAIALAGIGAGGLLYAGGASERRPTLAGFALTCALEALALALPFALGDRIAFAALVLRGLGGGGFAALALGWSVVAGMVVLPAALVAGYQFPLLVALLGSGRQAVGRDVGLAYGWNTAGSIAGALAGGFGLLPLLSAPFAWRLAALLLAASAALAAWASGRRGEGRLPWRPVLLAAGAALLLAATGPTAAWRHSGIGAGRFQGEWHTPNGLRAAFQSARAAVTWEAEGNESSVALWGDDDYAFFINGKSDGSARGDAATQVMSGLVGALLHPQPRSAMVIGLGTGSTAGWLAAVPGLERVDAAEIEPAIVEVARACAPVNRDCLRNPRLRLRFGDARELLLVSQERYDLIFSEPSNPYRAGISSLFTTEFYAAAAARLQPGGIFLQWVQGYEVDAEVVRTAFATLNSVFPYVETWQIHHHDLLLVATREPIVHDVARLRARVAQPPFAAALDAVWGVSGLEGFYTGFLAPTEVASRLRLAAGGDLSTDDRPRIEFGFIRNLGRPGLFDLEQLRQLAGGGRPALTGGEVDWARVADLRQARAMILRAALQAPADPTPAAVARWRARAAFARGDAHEAVAFWFEQAEEPASRADLLLVAGGLAARGDPRAGQVLERLRPLQPTETLALEALWWAQRGEPAAAVESLRRAWRAYRADPWPHPPVMAASLDLALRLASADPDAARILDDELAEPFAVHLLDRKRQLLRVALADQVADAARCWRALAPFESAPLWERPLLEARARCYARSGESALARRAARDLETFIAAEPRPLEGALRPVSSRAFPRAARPAAPRARGSRRAPSPNRPRPPRAASPPPARGVRGVRAARRSPRAIAATPPRRRAPGPRVLPTSRWSPSSPPSETPLQLFAQREVPLVDLALGERALRGSVVEAQRRVDRPRRHALALIAHPQAERLEIRRRLLAHRRGDLRPGGLERVRQREIHGDAGEARGHPHRLGAAALAERLQQHLGAKQRKDVLAGHPAEHADHCAVADDLGGGAGDETRHLGGAEHELRTEAIGEALDSALDVERVDGVAALPLAAEDAARDQRDRFLLLRLAARKEVADLEEPARRGAAPLIEPRALDEIGQQRAPHHGVVGGQRVDQAQRRARVALPVELPIGVVGVEGVMNRLREARGRQQVTRHAAPLVPRIAPRVRTRDRRQRRRNGVEADVTNHLLEEVRLFDGIAVGPAQAIGLGGKVVVAPRRHRHAPGARFAGPNFEPQAAQNPLRLLARDLEAGEGVETRRVEPPARRPGGRPRAALVDWARRHLAAGDLGEQARGARGGERADAGIGAALETMRGVGLHPQAGGDGAHRLAVEMGALDEHLAGAPADLGVQTAHHAGERDRPPRVGDDQHAGGKLALDAVERHHLLAGARRANADLRRTAALAGTELVEVEGMQRLPQLPEHEVGDVDDVVDRAGGRSPPAAAQPLGAEGPTRTPRTTRAT